MQNDDRVLARLDHFVEMLAVMAIQGELKHRVHYVFRGEALWVHLESAYDSFRQHCKRIDYDGELVDLKALRRLLHENHRQGGYVAVEGERIYFSGSTDRRRAFLVLSDVHYPGWEVRCDGSPAALVRCDYAIMGTVVPAGEHEVSFRFRPTSLRVGGAISALTALGLIVGVLVRPKPAR